MRAREVRVVRAVRTSPGLTRTVGRGLRGRKKPPPEPSWKGIVTVSLSEGAECSTRPAHARQ